MFAGSAEEASAALAKLYKRFAPRRDNAYFEHRIHDKGDNRNVSMANGYCLKDGGGGVDPARNHYRHVGNLTPEFSKQAYKDWFDAQDSENL